MSCAGFRHVGRRRHVRPHGAVAREWITRLERRGLRARRPRSSPNRFRDLPGPRLPAILSAERRSRHFERGAFQNRSSPRLSARGGKIRTCASRLKVVVPYLIGTPRRDAGPRACAAPTSHATPCAPRTRHFERDPIPYALDTGWPVGAAGFEPGHQKLEPLNAETWDRIACRLFSSTVPDGVVAPQNVTDVKSALERQRVRRI
jgi:hypothetical protein